MRHITALIRAGVDLTIIAGERTAEWNSVAPSLRLELEGRLLELERSSASGLVLAKRLAWLTGKALTSRPHRQRLGALPSALRVLYRQGVIDIAANAASNGFGEFDAIIAHFGPNAVRAENLRRAGLIAGPLAAIFHGYDVSHRDTLRRNLPRYRRLFASAQKLLPVSHFWLDRLLEWGAPARKLRVLRMGVDLPEVSRSDFDYPVSSPLRVLAVGRFTEKKGLKYAIRAVKRCGVPCTLGIVGYGELESELRLEAESPAANPVIFHGSLPHERVLAKMYESDVFLLPSVVAESGDMEGVPVVLMEAMARGCVVIATRHAGIPELIETGRSGLLVSERSSVEIADALEAIASGVHDLPALRRNARTVIERRFNGAALDRELLELVRSLANERSGSRTNAECAIPS